MEDGFDAANLAVLNLEQLRQLPRPVDVVVVEEGEGIDDAALAIDGDEPSVADTRDDAAEGVLELLFTVGLRRRDAVLETLAVGGERVVALAVVAGEAGEVVVGGFDQLFARRPLRFGNHLTVDRVRLFHRLHCFAGRREAAGTCAATATGCRRSRASRTTCPCGGSCAACRCATRARTTRG